MKIMKEDYYGVVQNYRRGPKSQKTKDCLIKIYNLNHNKINFLGKIVGWPSTNPCFYGKITRPHGRKGTFRVRFSKNLPGQALGTHVVILRER
jgi:ribosomal protein L35AE/L33A